MNGMKKVVSVVVMLIGIGLVAAGFGISIPGDHLTTWSSLRDVAGYSYIEEYVGGDAYNFIIGASLVAGHISGNLAARAIFIAGGVITACIGLVSLAWSFGEKKAEAPAAENGPDTAPKYLWAPGYNVSAGNDTSAADETNETSAAPAPADTSTSEAESDGSTEGADDNKKKSAQSNQ